MKKIWLWSLILAVASPTLAIGDEVIIEPFRKILPGEEITGPAEGHPGVMRPDPETRHQWGELARTGPRAFIDPAIKPRRGSVNLLGHLSYNVSERDQGSCGDCWAWAGTACLGIALDVQEGTKDRLSMQFINSCYGTGSNYACCGGWAEYVSNFYAGRGFCIPWSNANASFQDGLRACSNGSSLVSCSSIGTSPSYPISSCTASYITTQGVSQATAIANIKNILSQNKAVWFAFYAPNSAADSRFMNFWNYNNEYQCLPNYLDSVSCNQWWDSNGWGHAVLCYGYNDNDPNNSVWYMLNSWGWSSNRPNGTFLVDMDLNYSCQSYDPQVGWDYNYYWAAYDVSFGSAPSVSYRVLAGGDYNGDEYSDIAVFRPSTGMWAIRNLSTVYFGTSSDIPVPGDYNGDGTTDIAVFRPSTGKWAIRNLSTVYFGNSSDTPAPGDYDGNGRCDIATFRASTGLWAVRNLTRAYFGSASDKPVPGRYATSGKCEIAVFRPSNGMWSVRGLTRFYFGKSGDIPIGNYRVGENSYTVAIFRPSNGFWSVRGETSCYFGSGADQPVPGDFDDYYGDEIAVFRGSTGKWAIRNFGNYFYGTNGDIPVTR